MFISHSRIVSTICAKYILSFKDAIPDFLQSHWHSCQLCYICQTWIRGIWLLLDEMVSTFHWRMHATTYCPVWSHCSPYQHFEKLPTKSWGWAFALPPLSRLTPGARYIGKEKKQSHIRLLAQKALLIITYSKFQLELQPEMKRITAAFSISPAWRHKNLLADTHSFDRTPQFLELSGMNPHLYAAFINTKPETVGTV